MFKNNIVFCLIGLCFIFPIITAEWQDFNIDRVIVMNETEGKILDFHLRAKRTNRTHYVVTGSVDARVEDISEYDAEILLFYSSQGNNQFILTPFKITRKPVCEFINSDYRKLLMVELHPVSNLPYSDIDEENLCLMLKSQSYVIDNFIFNKDVIPQTMDPGLYKGVVYVNKLNDIVTGLELYFKLS